MNQSSSSSHEEAVSKILLQCSPIALATVEGDRYIIRQANSHFCRLLGKPESSLIGAEYADVALDKELLTALARAHQASASELPHAPEIVYNNSTSRSYTIYPVPATADHPHGAIMQVIETIPPDDLTRAMNEALMVSVVREHEHRKTAEALLRRLEEETKERRRAEVALDEARRLEAIAQLAGQIAHDFNNLLTIIRMNASIARQSQGADLDDVLVIIDEAAKRGTDVTKALLAMARRQPLAPEPADLAEQCAKLKSLLAATCGPSIPIVLELPNASIWANIDIGGLSRAVLNIGLNSRDAMPEGGTLTVRLATQFFPDPKHCTPQSLNCGSYAVIEIGDTGTGMSPEVMQKCFDPFFSTKGKVGLGLGLASVYGFAVQSGGTAEISSELGEGTTVRLFIPTCLPPACQNNREPAADGPHKSHRVLLVDDEADIRKALEAMLKQAGYLVTSASSASMALSHLGKDDFDIMVSDIVMPGMDGVALAQQVAREHPSLTIVLMTGFGMRPPQETLPWKLIEKPFGREEILTLFGQIKTGSVKASAVPAGS